jgi:cation transport ATPase
MFDLENSIREWRKQMLAAGIQSPTPLEELEIHLREEIERQINSGLNEQKALGFAVQKIGNAKTLQDEFEKNQLTKAARDWKLKEKLVIGVLSIMTLLIAYIVLSSRLGTSENNLTNSQQISVLAAPFVMLALVLGGRFGHRFFPKIYSKRLRNTIGISSGAANMMVLIYWFNFVLPQHNYTVSQVVVAVLWVMALPTGIFIGLIAGIETAAWKNSR